MGSIGRQFLLFHLGDAYSFFSELMATQATSVAESEVFEKYEQGAALGVRRYGRAAVLSVFLPFAWACSVYRGYVWKGVGFYAIVKLLDAFYDAGMYLRFFIHGPKTMREIANLNPEENFAAIQMRLFMRFCAMNELKKARGDIPKKTFTELCVVKSFRNQIKDRITAWQNFGVFLRNAGKR